MDDNERNGMGSIKTIGENYVINTSYETIYVFDVDFIDKYIDLELSNSYPIHIIRFALWRKPDYQYNGSQYCILRYYRLGPDYQRIASHLGLALDPLSHDYEPRRSPKSPEAHIVSALTGGIVFAVLVAVAMSITMLVVGRFFRVMHHTRGFLGLQIVGWLLAGLLIWQSRNVAQYISQAYVTVLPDDIRFFAILISIALILAIVFKFRSQTYTITRKSYHLSRKKRSES